MRKFSIVVAFDKNYGIGLKGQLPWHLPADLKHFKSVTTTVQKPTAINAVVMGRVTWDSLPLKFRPLPNRLNVVISSRTDLDLPQGVLKANSIDQALELVASKVDNIFIIGGATLYQSAIDHPGCESLYVTHVNQSFDCDAFFPKISPQFMLISASEMFQDAGIEHQFCHYIKHR